MRRFTYVGVFRRVFGSFKVRILDSCGATATRCGFVLLFRGRRRGTMYVRGTLRTYNGVRMRMRQCLGTRVGFKLDSMRISRCRTGTRCHGTRATYERYICLNAGVVLECRSLRCRGRASFIVASNRGARFVVALFRSDFRGTRSRLRRVFQGTPRSMSPIGFTTVSLLLKYVGFPCVYTISDRVRGGG